MAWLRFRACVRAWVLGGAVVAGCVGGCASVPSGVPGAAESVAEGVVFDASSYPGVFEHAKAVLRERGFELDRVDSRTGVLTTRGLLTAGAFTPWVGGAGIGSALDDALHRNERVVRVTFTRWNREGGLSVDRAAWPGSGGRPDLRLWPGSIAVRVEVDVFRVYDADRRLDADSVRLSHTARRDGLVADGDRPAASRRVSRVGADRALAESLLAAVLAR